MNLKKMMTTMNSTALDFFLTFSIYFVNIKTNEKKKYWELKSRKVHHISNNLPFHLIVTKKLALNFSCEVLYPLCLHYRSFFNVYKQYQNDCRCYILIYMSDIKEPIHPLKALDETNPIFASPTVVFTSGISYDFSKKRPKFPPRGGQFAPGRVLAPRG